MAISCGAPGLIYVNGRLAGEASVETPLTLPVAPNGVIYVEVRPFGVQFLPAAHKITMRGGVPTVSDGVACVLWACGVCEIELPAPPARAEESEYFNIDGVPGAILRGHETRLRFGAGVLSAPDGAQTPALARECAEYLLIGRTIGGMYACCFAREGFRALGACEADLIEAEPGGKLTCLTRLNDVTGHARVETWLAANGRFSMEYSEFAWADGAPRAPNSPEETARAAVEAAILGIGGEADSFLSPDLRGRGYVKAAINGARGCVHMKYAPPSAENAVGLLHIESDSLARVVPLPFRATPSGGEKTVWQISKFGG